MLTFGFDFSFYDPTNTYGMMDDIIAFINKRSDKFKFVYSTVGRYLKEVKSEYISKKISL